jgi:hypothetical protein
VRNVNILGHWGCKMKKYGFFIVTLREGSDPPLLIFFLLCDWNMNSVLVVGIAIL